MKALWNYFSYWMTTQEKARYGHTFFDEVRGRTLRNYAATQLRKLKAKHPEAF